MEAYSNDDSVIDGDCIVVMMEVPLGMSCKSSPHASKYLLFFDHLFSDTTENISIRSHK